MSCPDYDTLLGFVQGTLDASRHDSIQEHVDGCGDCFAATVDLAESLEEASPGGDIATDETLAFVRRDGTGFEVPLSQLEGGTGQKIMSKLGSPGTDFDHFRVIRTLGRGGMGEVYLARDMKLGRKVALKVIKPALLGSDELLSRFLFEAKTTARFNHPHIVTIYGVGQVQGMPYVALEYLEGQDLRTRIQSQPPGQHEALRIMLAVSEAIEEAHKHDILHRDLKPANVLMPTDGRVRVVDFGLAMAVQDQPATASTVVDDGEIPFHMTAKNRLVGTPAYMAPEQWRGEECTEATDVWAIGLILFELCVGRPPVEATSSAQLRKAIVSDEALETDEALQDAPEGVAALVEQCLRKDPKNRPNAGQVVEQLREMLYEGKRFTTEGESPFRGLLPFTERHAHWFFGRDVEISHCVEHLRQAPMVAVVGASGAGKSSFVQAGVIPRLRELSPWVVLRLRPGRHPIRRLASKVISGLAGETGSRPPVSSQGDSRNDSPAPVPRASAVDTLSEQLMSSPGQLSLRLTELANSRGSMVLLLVDQMEELFTQTAYAEEQRAFLDALCAAGDDGSGPIRVMMTLRDDFLGHLAGATANAKSILQDVVMLTSPSEESLRSVVTKPLEMVGFQYETPSIVDDMLAAVEAGGGLPLLQFTARMLWDGRDVKSREIKRSHYNEIGGVQGALAQHAESVLQRFTSQELNVARTLFLRMVTPERTRRSRSQTALVDGLNEPGVRVLDHLVQSRLVSARRTEDMDEQEAVFEFAHESLLLEWPTLARWLDENREEIVFLNEVGQAAALWNKRGRRAAELWTGDALRNAVVAQSRATTPIPAVVQEFIEQGAKRDGQIRLRRRFWSISLPLIFGVVALVFAFQKYEADYQRDVAENQQEQAYLQQEQAIKSQALAEQQRVEALLENARGALERNRPLEARAKLRMAMEKTTRDLPAIKGLWWQLIQDPLVWVHDLGTVLYEAAWSPNGQMIAVGTQDRTIYLFDAATKASRILRDPKDQVHGLAFSPESKLLVSGDSSGYLYVHDATSGHLLYQWQGHQRRISDVVYHPTKGIIASAGDDGFIRIWEPDTQRELQALAFQTQDIRFDPGGTLLAAGHREQVGLWQVENWRAVDFGDNKPFGVRVAFYSDQNHLATGTVYGKVHLWSSVDGSLIREMGENAKPVNVLMTSPHSPHLLTGHSGYVKVWDGTQELEKGLSLEGSILDGAFSPDGKKVALAGSSHQVNVWNVDRIEALTLNSSHTPLSTSTFSSDGESVVTASGDGVVSFWDVAEGRVTAGFSDQPMGLRANLSPDGSHVAWAGWSGALHVHGLPSTKRKFIVQAHLEAIVALEFNSSSTNLVTGSDDGHAKIWDLDGALVQDIDTGRGPVLAVSFSPDGSQLATTGPSGVSIWDVASGEELRFSEGPKGYSYALDWSPDGNRIVFGNRASKPWIWNLGEDKAREVNGPGRINGLVFHPKEDWIGMACVDNTVRVIDLGGRVIGTFTGHQAEVNIVDFSPDGRLISSAGDDGRVRTWEVQTEVPHWKTVGILGSQSLALTHRGWESREGESVGLPAPSELWRKAEDSALAVDSRDGALLCLLNHSRELTVWNASSGKNLATEQGVGTLIATGNGCLARQGERVLLYTADNPPRSLEFKSTAQLIGAGGEYLHVVTGEELLLFDNAGALVAGEERIDGVSAITAVVGPEQQDLIAIGFEDGVVELSPLQDGEMGIKNTLQGCPNSPVSLLMAGPPGSIIVGFEDGSIGLWGLRDGLQIRTTRLHGAIRQGELRDGQLTAATDLGEVLAWNLSPFYTPACDLLQQVWQEVPVTWQRGQAIRQEPPAQHPCFPEEK